jgi:hypothetical protein
MLECFKVTKDNIEEVAKAVGQRVSDVRAMFDQDQANNKTCRIWVERPDNIPEDFMRAGR